MSNKAHKPIIELQSLQKCISCRPPFHSMVCLFLCQFRTVVTTSAKTLPSLSPGTSPDLIPSCPAPFSCSQGFGAPDHLPSTLPSLHSPQEPGVPESLSPEVGEEALGPAGQRAWIPPQNLSTPTCCSAGVMRGQPLPQSQKDLVGA